MLLQICIEGPSRPSAGPASWRSLLSLQQCVSDHPHTYHEKCGDIFAASPKFVEQVFTSQQVSSGSRSASVGACSRRPVSNMRGASLAQRLQATTSLAEVPLIVESVFSQLPKAVLACQRDASTCSVRATAGVFTEFKQRAQTNV